MEKNKIEGNGAGALILVVDDDATIIELVDLVLTQNGFKTRNAANIKDAVKLAEEESFDLAILDIFLPDGTGLELARKIKSRNPKLPVIIMTGTPDSGNVKQAVDIEVDAYLIKPVDVDKLISLVKDLL